METPESSPSSHIWQTREEPALSRETLAAIFENRIPCVRIRGFASAAECDEAVAAMDAVGLHRTYEVPKLARPPRYIGIAQFEFRKRTKDEYFAAVAQAWREHEAFLEHCSWDPLARLVERLRAVLAGNSVTLAEEPGYGRYYAGVIRDTSGGGTLHADVTMYGAPDYAISAIVGQITSNVFATGIEDEGGMTTIHNRPFRQAAPADGRVEIEGFDRRYVEGAETYRYAPVKGDVVLFNSHNPHEWTAVGSGRRMGIASYFGLKPDGNVIYWS